MSIKAVVSVLVSLKSVRKYIHERKRASNLEGPYGE